MKISVIIAAYNAERYLEETLNSIVHQTLDDYEIIVVDDGSLDRTGEISDRYAKTFPAFTVIHQKNGGPSAARNAGLDIAKGKYIYFFDADDILENDALECLYETAEVNQADLIIAKYDIFNHYKTFRVTNINDLVQQDDISRYDTDILWTFSLCNKLFKRELIEKYHFRLPAVSYSEDGAFLMNYVYHAEKISGLDKVIFHYRRMYEGDDSSITASVSPEKIRDYVTAHQMILDDARESIVRDFGEYGDLEKITAENIELHNYLNEIIYKELQILLNQFYTKFWTLEESVIELIGQEVREKLSLLDMRTVSRLTDIHPELSMFHFPTKHQEALDHPFFAAVLYGEKNNESSFLECLESLIAQNLVNIQITVPLHMKSVIQRQEITRDNIIYTEAASEEQLFYDVLGRTASPYIIFCDARISYMNNCFKKIYSHFIKSNADFVCELIYHGTYGEPQPTTLNQLVFNILKAGYQDTPYLCMDHTLANKFFRTEYLRSLELDPGESILKQLNCIYKNAYFTFFDDKTIVYTGTDDSFFDYVACPESREFILKCMEDSKVNLDSPELQINKVTALPKLQDYPDDIADDEELIAEIEKFKKEPLKNQVLFFSIRKDGELEGNAKALYPHIEGEKKVCACQLPHDRETQREMYHSLITSKVIVTDDYVRYLRHFPTRDSQRVIQLWHACGAFKKFGQRGTNLSLPTDRATHAQYNLVCVSGEYIRSIYADAFGINMKKVKALGTPRTDVFFDALYKFKIKWKIYCKHPNLIGKQVILYAPTFRDVDNDRTQFRPELDFDKLSKSLRWNQVMIICPHPVMKNDIIEKKYPNIFVMRDFSTNDYMFVSNMLITDYSSVIFEYALLKKPIAFFCYDLAVYNRGFYLNYPDDLPGDVYETDDELIHYLQDKKKHILGEKYNMFVKKYMSGCDGHSCERIAGLINSYMEESGDGQ